MTNKPTNILSLPFPIKKETYLTSLLIQQLSRLHSLICSSLRRVIDECWRQMSNSTQSPFPTDDGRGDGQRRHREFLVVTVQRLRKILALLETTNDSSVVVLERSQSLDEDTRYAERVCN